MGQKTHPLGFRLGIVQEHQSIWHANFNEYSSNLEEDNKIRTYIDTVSRVNSISKVKIYRNILNTQIKLIIETGKPGILVGPSGKGLKILLKNLKKLVPPYRQIIIEVSEVKFVNREAKLLADLIANELEKRKRFRKVIRDILRLAKNQNINGIKIQVSGRLNGAEIARSEWIREGRVPLQTLRADIDYATAEANTIYGILGIKVWFFKSEILSK
jgi:small subunit ribosomal protein S3